MRHKLCRSFHPWCPGVKNRCLFVSLKSDVNIGSGNGLLPYGTKPLPEPMLIYILALSLEISTNCYVVLTHSCQVMHICFSKQTIIGSDNGLLPGLCQAIIWTNAGILLNRTLGTNFNENLIKIHTFSLKEMHLKTSSRKWRPFYLGLNVLNIMLAVDHILIQW